MESLVLVTSRSFGDVVKTGLEKLRDAGFRVERVSESQRPLDEETLASLLAEKRPEAMVTGAESFTARVISSDPDLRVLAKHGVGYDNIDLEAANEAGVAVANAPGTNTQSVADFTLGLLLSLAREISKANQSTKSGGWERFIGTELYKKTIGVIGTGNIGRQVIKRLQGFDPQLLGYDVVKDEDFADKYGLEYVGLSELLGSSDFITLHLPLNSETEGLIAEEELDTMKDRAYLVNAARGEIVDQDALKRALKEGKLAGAALDAFSHEPPEDKELLQLPNVVATPHIAAYTYEAMERMDSICAANIISVFEGDQPEYLVNPEAFG